MLGLEEVAQVVDEVTDFPLRPVITSPCARPAWADGDPARVPSTTAPVVELPLADEPLPEFPNPKPPLSPPPLLPLLLPASDAWTLTPRNPVAPMWMVDDELPASICLAIERAVAIGMA